MTTAEEAANRLNESRTQAGPTLRLIQEDKGQVRMWYLSDLLEELEEAKRQYWIVVKDGAERAGITPYELDKIVRSYRESCGLSVPSEDEIQ